MNLRFKSLFEKIKNIRKQILNLSLYLLASVITSIIAVIMNPFYAINLSPKDYAIIGYFTSFNMLVLPIMSFSLISYYTRNYFRIKDDDRHSVLDTLLVIQLFIGLIGLLISLIGFYVYIQIAKVNFPFFPFAILCFVPIFFSCFYNFLLLEKRMKGQAQSYFKIVLLNAILGTGFMVLFVVILKNGAIGRFWAVLIPAVVMGIYSFIRLLSKFKFDIKIFFDAIGFGWPITLSAILYYFLSGIDRAMLEQLNDTTTFGIYNVAIQITAYLYFFFAALLQTFEPDIYKSIAENNKKKLIRIVLGIMILNSIPTVLFIWLAHPVVSLLTAGKYVESATFAQILAFKNIAIASCFLVSDVIIGYGYPKVELINRTIGAILSIIMFKILIDKYGFYGAAWGQSFAFILMTGISVLFIVYKLLPSKKKKLRIFQFRKEKEFLNTGKQ